MTDREKELERLLRRYVDHSNGCRCRDVTPEARAFLASSPAQEEKRYTSAEVEALYLRTFGGGLTNSRRLERLLAAFKGTP